MISMHANASIGFQDCRTVRARPLAANGSNSTAPSAQRVNTTRDGDSGASTATLIIR
ncbi:hypothetical protein ABKA17_26660 [Streptomyces sp. RG80]